MTTGFWLDLSGKLRVSLYYVTVLPSKKIDKIKIKSWKMETFTLSKILLFANQIALDFAIFHPHLGLKDGCQKINRSDGFQIAFILEGGNKNPVHLEKWLTAA